MQFAVPSGHLSAEVEALLASVCDWHTFDVFQLDACSGGHPLQVVSLRLLETLGVVQRLQLDVARLSSFLAAAEGQYFSQPYHNNTHAADVVQGVGCMMAADSWAGALEDWEALALVIGAAVHDLGHPGVNNDFHKRTNSEAAQTYKDVGSFNENSHAALALGLLSMPENDFLEILGDEKSTAFKDLLKDLILCTDMAHHASVVESFSAAVENHGPELSGWPIESRRGALRMVLHCADISNPARPLEHCTRWGMRVQEELYGQGDQERALGLPPTPACERSNGGCSRSQAAFIKHVMQPSIARLAPFAPNFVESVQPRIDDSFEFWSSGVAPAPMTEAGSPSTRNSSADVINYLAP